jgi:hypothetical protein
MDKNINVDVYKTDKTTMMGAIISILVVAVLIFAGYAWYKDRQYTALTRPTEPDYYRYGSYIIPGILVIILILGIIGGLKYQFSDK